ncbi:hypothetical protein VNO78_29602 [Psophocarpus tetragonolobus]|uniref:Uncharacterized protein n=1 Tax=Psophocarpus tetragonolobus TaxID=3891 RepID=A0AAN9RVJ7_PSOTE
MHERPGARAPSPWQAARARARTSALAGMSRARAHQRPGRQCARAHQRPGRQCARAHQRPGRQRARAHQRPGRQRARARAPAPWQAARARARASALAGSARTSALAGSARARARTSALAGSVRARAPAPVRACQRVSICLHAIGIVGCGWPVGVDSSERDGEELKYLDVFHFGCINMCEASAVHVLICFVGYSACGENQWVDFIFSPSFLKLNRYSLFDGIYYSDNRSNSRANTCNKPRLLEGMHLLDKRSTQALPVALMIHDNSSDRTAFVPATHHSNFCPINFRCWTLGWVDRSASGVHRLARPFCRRCAPGLNWPGRASGAVTLKKLERTTAKAFAKDVFINQERKLGARRRSDTVLVSTINDADQGSADVAFRTPLAPYEKSKSLGSGGSMVARLKLKGIDGRAPPGVEPAA